MGASYPKTKKAARAASAKTVSSASNEDARAAGLAPYPLVAGTGLRPVVVSGVEFPIVYPQFAVEEMQLLDSGMGVRRVVDPRREADQHAHTVPLRIGRQ